MSDSEGKGRMLLVRLALYAIVIVLGVRIGGFFGGLQVGVCGLAATIHVMWWFTRERP